MANIEINDLKSAGAELLIDSESFMNALGDDEMNLRGGIADWSTASNGCGSVGADEWSTVSNGCRDQQFFQPPVLSDNFGFLQP